MLTTISFHPFKVIFISLATPMLFNYALFRFCCCHHQISMKGKACSLQASKCAHVCALIHTACTVSGSVPWKMLRFSCRSLCFPPVQFRPLDIIFLQDWSTSSSCLLCTSSLHQMIVPFPESETSQIPFLLPSLIKF